MSKPYILSIIESPSHPAMSPLYERMGYDEVRVASQRKAIAQLKQRAPAVVVADFIYAFSTYYQATNISNLDVMLNSLVKYAPQAQVIVLVAAADRERVEPLNAIVPLHGVCVYPVAETQVADLLESLP